ncbi:alpha/beta fold hydrolase [Alcaligenaceae bacterium CGII-47]|nr:alpha/beta fold hydrolase [Alcaligenaceae bacterium CGII-47]
MKTTSKSQPSTPFENTPSYDLDRMLHGTLARLTQGISPAALTQAWVDWALHLAFSPGKQLALTEKALHKTQRLTQHAAGHTNCPGEPCIEPLPQDKRFSASEWQHWPFNLIYQSFLLNQQWWHNATTDVRGVTRHHEELVTFAARQALDMVSPSNFFITNPEVLAETYKTGGMNLWQGMRNWIEDAQRLAARQPPAGVEQFRPGHEVAITPGKVVFRNRLIELIQYAPQTETVFAEPILIVPSWILKYYILDLSPDNSLVRYLVGQGHTVFMVSWRNPDKADRDMGMDAYLKDGIMAALDAVTTIVPGQRVQGFGYCLGGTLLAIAAAAMARDGDERMTSLTLLASLVDFADPGELGLFIDESQLAYLDDAMSAQGYLDGKQMSGAFALLNSRDLVFSRRVRDYLMGKRQAVTDLTAWNADATRMPFRQHSEYLRSLYLDNDLAQGNYQVTGRPVALMDIKLPIFCLGTQRDTVSPWKSVYKINLLTETEVTFCLSTGGHNVGVVNPPGPGVKRGYQLGTQKAPARYVAPEAWQDKSPSYEGSWWPACEAWLQSHASERVAPPEMGNKAGGYAVLDDAPGQYVLIP